MSDPRNPDNLHQHDTPTSSVAPWGSGGAAGDAARVVESLAGVEKPGDSVGPYTLLSVLGEGGFGMVFLAERRSPIVQRVALKIIKPGMDSKRVVARFEQERQALAVMDHPGVARVFDAGTTSLGRPYFVMEYVQGQSITDYCDRKTLTTRERLELFVRVCEAVQHAHMKGIIHRDLKPSNILVSEVDGRPVLKVIDFGIAKAISSTVTGHDVFTEQGQLIGTPEYMSPEQAEIGATDLDTRTDVYSLGVLLYELLSGTLPFDPRTLRSAAYSEIQRILREVEPPRPSTRFEELGKLQEIVAQRHNTRPADLRRELNRELEWIPLRAMRKDRTERYRSPAELADDVNNYLAGRPLVAGPESALYRFRKFIVRRRAAAMVGIVVFAGLAAGVAGIAVGYVQATDAARNERAAKEQEAEQRTRAEEAMQEESRQRKIAVAAKEEEARHRLLAEQATEEAIKQRKLAESAKELESLQRRRAEASSNFLHDMLASVDPEKSGGREVTVLDILDDASRTVGDKFEKDPEVEASLRETLGETYHQLSRDREALVQLRIAKTLRERVLGPDHKETLTTRFNIAACLLGVNEIPAARTELVEVLAARRRTLGVESEDALATQSLLGFATQLAGDGQEALRIFTEVLEPQKRLFGAGHKTTLETMASIADVLQDLGKLEEAEKAASEYIAAADAGQGPASAAALQGRSIKASILRDLGRYEESEKLCRTVLDAKIKMYGKDHSSTLLTQNALGQTLEQLKKYDEAADVMTRTVASAEKTLGMEHSATLSYTGNLARLQQLRGRLDEAEKLMKRVLEVRTRTAGPEAEPTLVVANNYGLLLLDMKKPAEAEKVFRDMLVGIDKVMPADHWIRGQARMNVGECLKDQKKFDEAEKFMLEGHELLVKSLPDGHLRIKRAAGSLATLYKDWGKADKEAEWREKQK